MRSYKFTFRFKDSNSELLEEMLGLRARACYSEVREGNFTKGQIAHMRAHPPKGVDSVEIEEVKDGL